MDKLDHPDSLHLCSAVGWLELGNPEEAKADLARIREVYRHHPDVLEVSWMIAAEQQDWEEGLKIARKLLEVAPDRPTGWLHQAYALRRVKDGGLEKAREALLPVAERFPEEPTILYNLSCYECQLGDLALAKSWLDRAIKLAGVDTIKKMALSDPDLKPIWRQIREL